MTSAVYHGRKALNQTNKSEKRKISFLWAKVKGVNWDKLHALILYEFLLLFYLNHIMRKPAFCISEIQSHILAVPPHRLISVPVFCCISLKFSCTGLPNYNTTHYNTYFSVLAPKWLFSYCSNVNNLFITWLHL